MGGFTTFNIQHGFTESLIRGMRSTFLTSSDYHHLTQCESLDDAKMNLQETDYGDKVSSLTTSSNSSSNSKTLTMSPSAVQQLCVEKLVEEINYLKTQSVAPLSQFLDFVTYEYMIENVMLLLKGTLSGRDVNELIESCHPLGMFKESTMRSIPTFESSAKGYADLYQTVLIDTPVGKYFSMFLLESSASLGAASEVRNVLEEVEIEIIKSSLIKFWLEDFHTFCVDTVGGDTGETMGEILKTRADTTAINITLNSFGTALNEPSMRGSDRKRLYPSFGHLYPAGTNMLATVSDEEGLGNVLNSFPQYAFAWSAHSNDAGDNKSIDDAFYERDVQMLELAFEGQFHFGPFYAYVKLKEQEIRNLVWITECILQGQKEEINNYVPIFDMNSSWRSGKR
ncbi:hypothetical protein ScalyP_jg6582 [Parmales sp. scaly parma]|nr:hypothetical protein ScalyP_jg6582 [Parmales sp. scaly parma]